METVAVPKTGVGNDVGAVLVLASAEAVGPLAIRQLLDRIPDPVEALGAAPHAPELGPAQRKGVADRLAGSTPARAARQAAVAAARQLARGDRLLAYGRPGYPSRLARLHLPPSVLWARGPLTADAPRAIAIVGTRRATRSARDTAFELAAGLAGHGVRIVSGLARGIDGSAHRGALSADGETAAVLGSGLRFRYPRDNHDLYERMHGSGLLLTEFAPAIPPEPHNFPRRNRIVAALSDAVLVVQAGERSGALLTARHAPEVGIDVLACPGDVRLDVSAGCHGLLRDGAGLVASVRDVLDLLGWGRDEAPVPGRIARPPASGPWTDLERDLLDRLDSEPASIDELAADAGPVGSVAAVLARLELAGAINGLPGGRYERAR